MHPHYRHGRSAADVITAHWLSVCRSEQSENLMNTARTGPTTQPSGTGSSPTNWGRAQNDGPGTRIMIIKLKARRARTGHEDEFDLCVTVWRNNCIGKDLA